MFPVLWYFFIFWNQSWKRKFPTQWTPLVSVRPYSAVVSTKFETTLCLEIELNMNRLTVDDSCRWCCQLKLLFEVFGSEQYESATDDGIGHAVQDNEHVNSVREQRFHPFLEFSAASHSEVHSRLVFQISVARRRFRRFPTVIFWKYKFYSGRI